MKNKQINKTLGGKTGKDLIELMGAKGQQHTTMLEIVAPVSEEESMLFNIWKSILMRDNFGTGNDFFLSGGNSLKAIQLASKISSQFDIHVELTDIFVNPTISGFAEFIKTKQNGHSNHANIEVGPRPENIPLSFSQERLWFIDRVEGSIPYHVPAVLRFKGALNKDALAHALQQIVVRHEALRTVIEEIDGVTFQRIKSDDCWQLTSIDGSKYSEDPGGLRKFIQQLIREPFDLSKDSMLRAELISLTEKDHLLVVTLHHIASDAWSLAILVKEFMELYNSFEEGRAIQLPPLELQYADYTLWQKQDGQRITLEKNLEYWKRKLDGVAPLQLPVDFARPVNRTTNGGALDFIVSNDLSGQLTQFSQEQGSTLFMVLLATFKVLLHRYSGQQDICVGTSIANRNRREVEGLIGFFVNTLALRTEVTDNISFVDLLNQVKLTTLAAYQHQNVPFEKIVEVVDTERDTSTSPLFQVMLVMPNTPDVKQLKLNGVETSAEAFLHNTSKYDITFFIAETTEGLQVSVEYNINLFNAGTIQKMSAHFEELLTAVVNDPYQKIGLLPMLTKDEQVQLDAFNDSIVAYPKDKTVVGLFEEQVIKTPDAIALVFERDQLSYKELNERANQLACYLRSRGVKEETLVPIFMERGLDMMVGIIGILKAGAAYVPIDTEFPAERISYMLEDTSSPILLCNSASSEKLSEQINVEVIEIDGIEIQLKPTQNIVTNLAPNNAAYVIYTSGSTGKPKGVIIEHRNLVDYVFGLNNKVQINHSKSFALVSTIATDLGNTVIYASLLSGGALHIFSKDATTNVELLHEYFATNKIDCLKIVPSHWKALCMGDELLVPAKLLVFGGEALRSEVVENIVASHPACKVVNHYGPTETTIGKLLHVVEAARAYAGTIPIGKPFSNTQVYILSKDMQRCPVGVPGQLYVAGDGVARGYYNNPALTDEKFVANPFASQQGAKMYGTGDMVRWLTDGNIEFIGRVDDQVKIRGYRIELGEIERVLLQSPLVSEAVVLAKEDKQGNKRLAGYIVPAGTYDKEGIIEYMKEKLPDYMIPTLLMELQSLPLTANGKIDRKSLPDPEASDAQSNTYTAPRTDAETALAEIWQELLDIETVGIHDNFFELGGDSIITIQLVSRARRAGYELQMGDVFTYQTIARLSALLDQRSNTSATASGEQFLLEGASGLLPIQQWFFDKEPTEPSHFNQTMLLRIDKTITEALLKRAIEQLTAHHDALRFKYYKKEGAWFQVYEHLSETSRVVVEDLQSISTDKLGENITESSDRHQKSLDIEKGELVRVVLMQTPASEDTNRLLFAVHHLAIDGVSWRILLEDLELLLTGFKNGSATELGNKTSSYRQWYDALVKYGQINNVLTQKNYWNKIVKNYQALPVDKEYTEPVKVKDITHHTMRLDAAQTRLLTHDVPRVYHTEINDILMAALAKTFTEFGGTDKVIIGMEGHGRESIEANVDTSRTVGWFTTHYPVLLQVNTGKGEDDLIKNVKEQLRQVPDKGLGFGVLKYINKEEAYQGKSSWDVIYNYLGQADNVFSTGQWLGMATESAGADRNPEYVVNEKLVLNGMVQGGELVLHWSYSDKQYEQETIIALADKFKANLESLINHCIHQQKNAGLVFTPSDYGLGKEISYSELDNFLSQPLNGQPVSKSLERMYRLSGLQQGMLFHGLYDGDGGAGYLNQFWCDLINPNLDALRNSWKHVMRSHDILRSAFYHNEFLIPVQAVFKEVNLPIDIIDYRSLTETEQAEAIKEFEKADKAKGFDFKNPPLMRISLLRLNDNRYRMLWSAHHILFDGWSRSILMGDFLKIYDSLVKGNSLPVMVDDQYENYIQYIELINKDDEQAYWKKYLQNIEHSTLLPFIGNTAERNKGIGNYKSVVLDIDKCVTEKVGDFAQRHRLTINTLVQGIWAYLLHRYTGSNDIVYGVIVSGRPDDLPQVEQRVGMFINVLPLQTNLREEETFVQWITNIQQDQVTSRNHQYTPLHEIQTWTGLSGDLFDSLLVFENYPVSKVMEAMNWNLQVENVQVNEHTNYPLTLMVSSTDEINIDFSYNTSLLDDKYVNAIRDHFQIVLMQVIENENTLLKNIEILTGSEKNQLLVQLNNTTSVYSKDKSVIKLFEEQVLKTPGNNAVIFEDNGLTYKELNQRSNQLARYLISKGVKSETLVPIIVDRSLEMLVGILGILKAGGAYVPIDSEYPEERIRYMLEDTDAGIIVVNNDSKLKLPTGISIDIIDLDAELQQINNELPGNPELEVKPDQLAYVIYTSGSTGHPKGVMVTHNNVVSLVKQTNYVQFSAADILLSTGSPAFDATTFEYWGMLLNGGQLVLCNENRLLDSELLKQEIAGHKVTMMWFTSSWFNQLVDHDISIFDGLKTILVGGEKLSEQHISKMRQIHPFIELINGYGPTENTTFSLTYKISETEFKNAIPIGRPLSNRTAFILDAQDRLVPIGVAGEIYLGGDGLSRGYLNRLDLTQEKFIEDPFSKIPDAKLYKTGDIGRWLPDGNIEYLGRRDDQVKIRGFRIELGEIESVLMECGLVMQATVIAKTDNEGTKRLIGYIVPNGDFDKQAIQQHLRNKLPDYMVPAILMEMEKLPLNKNGKVDRKALPDPDVTSMASNAFAAPRNYIEQVLASIWQNLLNLEVVGIHDNFFELGGHSLLATRIVSAIRKQLQVEIPIKDIFLYPTIEELALQVAGSIHTNVQPPIQIQERPEHIPLSFSQERLWFIDSMEGTLQYHVPAIIRLKGRLNKAALANSIQQIVNRHEVLRTVFLEEQGAGYQYVKEKDNWQLNIVDDLIFNDGTTELQQYIHQLIKSPFNLSSDYMLRAHLINLGDEDCVMVLTMHHIAADGWSISILVKELVELYAAFEEGRTAQLPPLNIQYADYAIWQRNYLQGEVMEEMLGYWKTKLEAVATLQLPADHSRPAVQSTRGASIVFNIEKDISEKLSVLSQQQGSTLFMTLLTAYKVMLHRYSGQQDICVGTPIANRTKQELESLIGFFINPLAIRSNLSDNPSFTSLLQQVKHTTLEAYSHQDVPFEKIVEAVVKERDLSRNPLFQVLFTMQNTPEVPELRLKDLQLAIEKHEHTTSQVDIVCNITERPEGLHGAVEYCTDLYTEQTIRRMMGHFVELLRSIVLAPEQKIGELKMLSIAEENQLLVQFNNTSVKSNTTATGVIDLFETQVSKNAAKLAVAFEEEQLTFSQLNERVNQLAAFLRAKGVKKEKLVPICVGRSIDMLVGILAILKAGGAYVPIDPEYPLERISYMLEDTKATIVLSNNESASKLPDEDQLDVIYMDGDWPLISMQPPANLLTAILPEQLAYIIYTSGSTGKPKGVLIEHRNLLSYLLNEKTNYLTNEAGNAGSFIHLSYTFDASVTAIFMPLLAGKSVVIGSKGSVNVFEDINLHKYAPYDFIKITPGHLALLQPQIKTDKGILLTKCLVLGGEALLTGQFSYLSENGLNVEIINEYGPTEATVGCSVFGFQTIGDNEKLSNGISIGKPIDNVQMHILGIYNELVPIGATGELCIGGNGLARGYLNLPELSAEKFVADPFNNGSKIYKTGDLARWLPDGNIQYLGRKDEQVKIRGYRVELGEIESVLQHCEYVSQAVVLAKDNKEGTKRLIAYVVPTGAFNKESIQDYLKGILPDYMVPVQWVEMESLPLTANGKIDRKSLPDPEASGLMTGGYVAPRNDFEIALAEIWQDLLDVEQVGIHDNFFELGGDSIIIIQIVSRARRAGFEFLVADVFTNQTIAKLSAIMDQKAGNGNKVLGEQVMLTGPAGLLPIQQWYLDGKETAVSHFNQSVLLNIDKAITAEEIRDAFDKLTAHHDALRFIYRKNEGSWQQEYGTEKGILVIENLQDIASGHLTSTITERAEIHQRSLDIEKGELVRTALFKTPATETFNRLLIVIHHLAVDGISWRIILEDLELILTGIKADLPADLGAKSSSYRQWHEALENYANGKRLKSQLRYWEQAVESYEPLPVDKKYTGGVKLKDLKEQVIRLDANITKALIQEVPRVYHTGINDTLMGALAQTLCEWAGTEKVVIGLEGHGREEIAEDMDTSHTVGWFTSMFPVLFKLNEGSSIPVIIKEAKEQLRRVPDKGLGFGVLKYIAKEEKFAGNKNWDIVFNYLGQLDNVVTSSKWLSPATESKGAYAAEEHLVNELITVNAMVKSGELVFNWSYSSLHFNPETISALAEQFLVNLTGIIGHCQTLVRPVFTPSDYGLGDEITNTELDLFLDEPHGESTRRESIESLYRLSGLQSGMLFHGLYDEGGAYMEQFCCDFTGLNLSFFSKSWNVVMKNHSILRSAFYYDAFNIPVQCVYNQVKLPVEVLDYRGMNESDLSVAIEKYKQADRVRGFDFKAAPLMRVGLIRISDHRYTMVWCFHHILFDGWSLPVLMEEFLTTYELLAAGNEAKAMEEDRYQDYIQYIERGNKEKEEQYWRSYMQGLEHSTLLPFIASSAERNKGVGIYKSTTIRIEADLTTRIQTYAQKHRLTINTLMQGIWSCLLHRYTGSSDVVYGVIVSGRPDDLPGVEKRVGLYINTLPLHSSVQEQQPVVEWLQKLQTEQVSSRQYQYTPLHAVQAWTGLKGDLFDSILVFENFPISKVLGAREWSLGVENLQTHEQTNYPITLTISSNEYINIRFRYNSSILADNFLQEIKDHFEHVLWQVVNEEVTTFNNIRLLTPAKETVLKVNFNDSQVDYPKDKTMVDLIQEQVEKNPGNIAVAFENNELTYGEFNERANQLAHSLRSKGVKEETLVPVFMERSLEMMVALLGILKAGGAYIPIDPEYPEDRIRYMLEDTRASVVICTPHSKNRLSNIENLNLVVLEETWAGINDQPVYNLPNIVAPHHLAYVIYTSGSTGRPKGVMIEHSALLDHCYGVIKSAGLQRCSSFALFAPLVFDAGHSMVHSAFILGASLHVISNRLLTDGYELAAYIDQHEIDCIKIVPSLWLAYADGGNNVLGKKVMIFGGEGFTVTVLDRLIKANYRGDVFNHYGPTEATIGKTIHKVDLQRPYNNIPIGKPFSNTQLYIVDPFMNIVPIGVAGELHIAGEGLARGYLNMPDLTSQKFINNPFSTTQGARMYKTGDQARWLPDGDVEYLGRMDDQVKIRGFRIEIGEIETVLQQSELVDQAVVIAKDDANGNKRLVSYIVPNDSFSKEAMASYLRSKLPDYMIPVVWVPMQSLPLNINGKIDKKNLPEPDTADMLSNKYVAPRTELETRLAEIWKEILQVERIGVFDNFFELGGHSLLVMRLISAVRREFKVELAIGAFFELPTVDELANYIKVNQNNFQTEFENYDTIEL